MINATSIAMLHRGLMRTRVSVRLEIGLGWFEHICVVFGTPEKVVGRLQMEKWMPVWRSLGLRLYRPSVDTDLRSPILEHAWARANHSCNPPPPLSFNKATCGPGWSTVLFPHSVYNEHTCDQERHCKRVFFIQKNVCLNQTTKFLWYRIID